MPVIAKGGVDTLVSAPPAAYLPCICRMYARKLREKLRKRERGRGEAPHQRPINALIDTVRGTLFSSLITKESVH